MRAPIPSNRGDDRPGVSKSEPGRWLLHGLTLLILLATVGFRLSGNDMRRPLRGDELTSIRYYTWASLTPEGAHHTLRRADDLRDLPRPSLKHFVLGLYCGLGRWPEPNNHVVNSVLMNVALALGPRSALVARLPAFVGAIGFAILLYVACVQFVDSLAAAPLAVALALWSDYLFFNSQVGRGYSWMISLELVMILLASPLARWPSSIILGASCASIAILGFMNVISLSVDFIVPFYLTMLIFPPKIRLNSEEWVDGDQATLRRNLVVQCLAIGAVGLIFLVDRLPAVVSSANLYGVTFRSMAELRDAFRQVLDELLPNWQLRVLAGLGLVGLWLPDRPPSCRFLSRLAAVTLFVSAAHFLASGRLPFGRVCGYVLPFLFLGFACFVRFCSTCPQE